MRLPLNREISQRVTPWLEFLRLSPNQVTGLSLGAGLTCACFFLQGSPAGWVWGALWLEISYVLDNCDGELARRTGRSSGLGSWLDVLSDCLIHMAFFLGLAGGLVIQSGQAYWAFLGVAASAGVFLTYLVFFLGQVRRRGASAWVHPDPPYEEAAPDLAAQVKAIARGDFSLVVLVSALAGQISWLLWAGTFGAFFYWFSGAVELAVSKETPHGKGG